MSSKKKIGIVIVVAVLAITFMTVAFLTTQTNTDYYTQIDNRWVTDIAPHGAMNYKYTLVAYNESGNAKDVTFETSKVLTDGAYLCLKVAPIRGVVTWAEMQFDELPSSVQGITPQDNKGACNEIYLDQLPHDVKRKKAVVQQPF